MPTDQSRAKIPNKPVEGLVFIEESLKKDARKIKKNYPDVAANLAKYANWLEQLT